MSSRISRTPRRRPFGGAGLRAVAGASLLLAAAGCDFNPLAQDAPSRVEAGVLEDPSNAILLVRSAVSEFECALVQHAFGTALVGDELRDGSLSEQYWDYDRRTLNPARGQYATTGCGGGVPGNYMALSAARFQADNALRLLDRWTDAQVPARTDLIAQAAAYAGYSLTLLGESMCSAAIDMGPELTRAQLFAEAESRFGRALEAAAASGNAEITNLSRVGRARARLNLGRLDQAGADAALVPLGFVVSATYSDASTRRQNRLFTAMYRTPVATVDPSYRGLTVGGVPDPRVAVINAGRSAIDTEVPLFQPAKYQAVSAPIRIASGVEAQLILAESRLAAGNVQGAVAAINTLRTRLALPAYGGGTAAEVRAQIIEERRRELFLEGHRLGDMIRHQVPLTPAPGTPFPRGGQFGDRLCFPLPDIERNNNPNI
jgi:starch-binding outer membrane protein, SusD/RagB family